MKMTFSEYERLVGASSSLQPKILPVATTSEPAPWSPHIPQFVPSSIASPKRSKKVRSKEQRMDATVRSKLEEMFALHLRLYLVPEPRREYRFHPTRKWAFDFAWERQKVAVEIEGGIYSGGRHTRGSGFTRDCDKYNAAQIAGWIVLRFVDEHLKDGTAIQYTREALGLGDYARAQITKQGTSSEKPTNGRVVA